jgi:hypothetical protein
MALEVLSAVGDFFHALYWWRLSLCVLAGAALSAVVMRAGERTEPAAFFAFLIMLVAVCTGVAWEWRSRHEAW